MSIVSKIPELIENWMDIYDTTEQHLKVAGNLSEQAAELPAHIGYYDETYRGIYNIRKRLDSELRRKRGELFRYYMEKYPKQLSTRDVDQYINSDKDFYELEEHLFDVVFWEHRFEAVVNALNSKTWMIGHITKLYVGGLEDVII